MKVFLTLMLTLSLLNNGQLLAAELTSQVAAVDPASSAYLVKLIIALVFIVLLIIGLAWLMKKMQLTQHSQNGLIHIVSAISVGHRDRIALIQVGDEQIVVGLTPGRIEKLHTLKTSLHVEKNQADVQPFAEKFNQLLQRNKNNVD